MKTINIIQKLKLKWTKTRITVMKLKSMCQMIQVKLKWKT